MRNPTKPLLAFGATLILCGCATGPLSHVANDPRFDALTSDSLTPFESETGLRYWLRQSEKLEVKRRKKKSAQFDDDEDYIVVTGSRVAFAPNITNVQNRGVDEGDIVKQVGDHLVLMQDGRLFSLSIGEATPTLTARIDIYSEVDEDIWYDELLVSGRRLVVTGYHYGENATEISVFDLDTSGQFTRQGTWYLESEDYYSDDNSATRMIGDTLIFQTSAYVDEPDAWPALREKNQDQAQPILQASDIYPPLLRLEYPSLHMVTECKLTQNLECKSRAVMGAGRSEWIVTEEAGYLWVGAPRPDRYLSRKLDIQSTEQPNTLYRFPIGTKQVEAVTLNADLNSRFAFEARDNKVLALVSRKIKTDATEEAELALLDMPMSEFSAFPIQLSASDFTPLPGEQTYGTKMRFTDDHLVYSNFHENPEDPIVYVMDLGTRLSPLRLSLPHTIQRLDRVGQNAVLIGNSARSLDMSWLDLSAAPVLTDTLELPYRFETGGRAQALNMRVGDDGSALLGLPTYFDGTDPNGNNYDEEDGADISFARVSNFGQMTSLGAAKGDPSRVSPDYKCETSCVDWYGNARPFFIEDRIFALIASELIELQETPNGLTERSRVNLSAPL